MPLYEYECNYCGQFDEFVSVENRNNVFCTCGRRAIKLISLPATDKDKAYEFYSENFGNNPVWVRSKTHYHKLRKKHNIIDASIKESFAEARIKRKSNDASMKIKRIKKAQKIADRIHKENVSIKDSGTIVKKLLKVN